MIEWGRPLEAPAKLNLFLHVVGRRADGYHLLQTAFRMVDRCDLLTFHRRAGPAITLATPLAGVEDGDNLVMRAARLLQREAGTDQGATIALDKRLPLGGGLGGGSSDAATVLIALNRLWRIDWPRERLQALALKLGADVPFFVFGRSAFAEGIGERLQPLAVPAAWYLVIEPGVSVATAEIFGDPRLTRDTEVIKMADFSAGWGRNDLQPVVCARHPEVARALEWLSGFGDARVTGSGSCVFSAFDSEHAARDVLAQLPFARGWVARGLDRHPLCALVGEAH